MGVRSEHIVQLGVVGFEVVGKPDVRRASQGFNRNGTGIGLVVVHDCPQFVEQVIVIGLVFAEMGVRVCS